MRTTVILGLVLAVFAFLAYRAIGTRLSGSAVTTEDIPIIGRNLSELDFVSPAVYLGFEHPHGGGSVTLAGSATMMSMEEFCREAGVTMSRNGSDVLDRQLILEQLTHFNELDDPIIATEQTLVLAGLGGRFRRLLGTYDPATKQFHLYVQFDEKK